jgi:hypothetical protein
MRGKQRKMTQVSGIVKIEPWEFEDLVTGIKIQIIEGKHLNRIHIDMPDGVPRCKNRDFYFTKEGRFDGTGSSVCSKEDEK